MQKIRSRKNKKKGFYMPELIGSSSEDVCPLCKKRVDAGTSYIPLYVTVLLVAVALIIFAAMYFKYLLAKKGESTCMKMRSTVLKKT